MTSQRRGPSRGKRRRPSESLLHRLLNGVSLALSNIAQSIIESCRQGSRVIFSNPLKKKSRHHQREQSVFKRNFQILGALCIAVSGGYAWMQDYPQRIYDTVSDSLLSTTQRSGFKVGDIVIKGRNHASSQQILEKIDLTRNDPIFKYSPEEVRGRLKQISWIRDAMVQRHLPDILSITIMERKPLAIWQNQKKHFLVDNEGAIISEEINAEYKGLPMIVGANAPIHVSKILSCLIKYPEIQKRVSALVLVSGRRWNLQLDGSIDIKLPEINIEEALERLVRILVQPNINFKEVKIIDLRQAKQVTMRMANGSEV